MLERHTLSSHQKTAAAFSLRLRVNFGTFVKIFFISLIIGILFSDIIFITYNTAISLINFKVKAETMKLYSNLQNNCILC